MTDFVAYLAAFAAIAASVWGAIHGIQRLTRLNDRWAALVAAVLGVSGGVVAQGCGFITTQSGPPWSWIGSAFFGFLATLSAAGLTDLNFARSAAAAGTASSRTER